MVRSALHTCLEEIRRTTQCEVRARWVDRAIYATDASMYRLVPKAVVIPRTRDDLVRACRCVLEAGLALLPRGAGTSLSGQSVADAVVVDASKYLRRITGLDAAARTACVEPGVVLDSLNAAAAPAGLMFGPDVATHDRATLGGMIGNNSCGARSIRYGQTIDHVRRLTVLLADGRLAEFAPIPRSSLGSAAQRPGLEGDLYRRIPPLAESLREEIDARFPPLPRRVGGYNLDRLLRTDTVSLADLIVGSEGTLAVVVEAEVALVPRLAARVLVLVGFDDVEAACAAVPDILAGQPSAVELVDHPLLACARRTPAYRDHAHLIPECQAVLIVELSGEHSGDLLAAAADIEARARAWAGQRVVRRVLDPTEQQRVWALRTAGLPLIMGTPTPRKPESFIEDAAVPVARLADYVRQVRDVLAAFNTEAIFYGHASVGVLHVRPFLDMANPDDVQRMRDLQLAVADIVLALGGTMSAEHGDGLVRSHLNRRIFGERVYEAFREIKQCFDPRWQLNPGKIVDAPPPTHHLRGAQVRSLPVVSAALDFGVPGGFAAAAARCNGNALCRKTAPGAMCPSYMVTGEEMHSTRGRANALREALAAGTLDHPHLREAMDLCVACKACRRECPSGVDLARLKAEWLYQVHRLRGVPLRDRLIGSLDRFAASGWRAARWLNVLAGTPPARWLLERVVGIDRRRALPRLATRPFHARTDRAGGSRAPAGEAVVLFADCFTNYFEPQVLSAAARVLRQCGYDVIVPQPQCCGRTMISRGLLADARRAARAVLARLSPLLARGACVVGVEPGCLLTFRDEYLALRLGAPARHLADRSFLIEEFLAGPARQRLADLRASRPPAPADRPLAANGPGVLLHVHCHQQALSEPDHARTVLAEVVSGAVEVPDAGCCGMAGAFGYERAHYDISRAMAERVLLPAVRNAPPATRIAATGTSCRHQIRDLSGRPACHPVEIVADVLGLCETEAST